MKKITLLIAFMLLVVTGSFAQVNLYSFAQSTGSYTAITGGTAVLTCNACGTAYDSESYVITLPTSFKFNGVSVNSVVMRVDGSLVIGSSATSSSTTPIDAGTTAAGVISALGMDLRNSTAAGAIYELRWEDIGGFYVFQWTDAARWAQVAERLNFQIRIDKTTGVVAIVYGSMGSVASSTTYQPQVGLRGTSSSDYIARRLTATVPDATPSWDDTVAATASTHTVRFTAGSPAAFPASGLTYTFTPPAGCGPAALAAGTAAPVATSVCNGIAPATITVTGATSSTYMGVAHQWEQSTNGGTVWSNVVGGTGANSTSYTPPVFAGTAIQYRLKVSCSGSDVYSSISAVSPVVAPTTQATALTATNTAPTTLSVSWTAGNGGRKLVYVSTNPITDPVSGSAIPAYTAATAYTSGQQIVYEGTGTSVTVTGLTCGTQYYVKVFEYNRCGSGPYDVYFNTTTGTNAITVTSPVTQPLPVNNNFAAFTGANLSLMPGWYEANGTTNVSLIPVGGDSNWTKSTLLPSATSKVNLYDDAYNAWMISPKMVITANSRLKFKAAITAYNAATVHANKMAGTDDKVNILVSTDGCGAVWTVIHTFNAANTTALTNVLTDFTIPLNYTGQTIQVAFQGVDGPTDDTPDYDFHIGSIVIEQTPQCDVPVVSAATNVTKNSATISWAAPTVGVPTGYQYVVSPTSTSPTGAGTSTTATSVNVSPLTPSTQYYVYVRTVCSSDFSDWSLVQSFTTLCDYPELTSTTPGSSCGQGTATLQAAAPAGAVIRWYAAATGGLPLATGTSYTTPVLTTTTNYYVNSGLPVPSSTITVGTSTGTDTSLGTSPYSHGWGGVKTQFIIKASELSEAGIVAGPINSIAFTIGTVGTATLNNFAISIGATAQTAATSTHIDGLSQVYTNAAQGLTVGVNSYTFTTPFNWDGTSNLVLQVCYSNANTGGTSSSVQYYSPGFTCTTYTYADNKTAAQICPALTGAVDGSGGTATSANRPKIIINGTALCAGPRTLVAATVNTPPVLTLSGNPAGICVGQTTAAVTIATGAGNYDTFVWTPSIGVSGNATTGWTFNPAVSTTYSLQASQSAGVCTATPVVVNVTVNPLPSTIVLADTTVCEGGAAVPLTPTGGTTTVILLSEGFNAATNTWTKINNSTGGTVANAAWTLRPDGLNTTALGAPATTWHSNDNSQFYMTNSDSQGSATTLTSTILSSPSFSTVGLPSASISFYHYFYEPSTTPAATGKVEVSLDNTTWVTLQTYTATIGEGANFAAATVALTAPYLNQATVYIRFKYDGVWRYYWGIDNVTVSGQLPASFTWSPVTALYTDAAATTAYVAGTPAATVYAKPTANTTYTVTATNASGCINTDTSLVTFSSVAAPTVPALTQEFCNAGTVADLVATGTGIKWYAGSTGGTALAPTTALVNNTQYFASQTVSGCESFTRTGRTAIINVVAAPAVANANPVFCNAATVADLLPNGANIKWYAGTTGGTALVSTTVLVSGTPYYASQTVNGCEGLLRATVTPTINVVAAPAISNNAQVFCNNATVADLLPNGPEIKWYLDTVGGTALASTEALVNGTPYYASQTVNGCEGLVRSLVTATVLVTPAPVVNDVVQIFCNAATVADLIPNDASIKWYAGTTGGMPLASTEALVNGTPYYASQTIDGCEGLLRTEVGVTINVTPAPVVDDVDQVFCNAATVADLLPNDASIKWYTGSTGGTPLASTEALVSGTPYFASQTIDGCEGLVRTEVAVTVNVTQAPTGDNEQEFCTSATVADLVVTGDVITWYDAETAGTALASDVSLTDGGIYYASQTIDGCEGLVRFGVTAVIHTVVADAPADVNVCTEYVLPALTNGAYFTEAGGTGAEVTAGTPITETTTLYVYAQEGTDIVCFDENSFTVTVANIAAPTGDNTQTIEGGVGPDVTVADLQTDPTTGTVTWYASEEDAQAGINALAEDTQLEQGVTYYATVTVGECTSVEVFAVTVDIVLDRENFDIKAFTFHPNPVKDILNLSYSSDITSVTVFNLLGQRVISQQSHATDVKVDMSSLADGAYVVNVTSGNTVKTIKVIKKQ